MWFMFVLSFYSSERFWHRRRHIAILPLHLLLEKLTQIRAHSYVNTECCQAFTSPSFVPPMFTLLLYCVGPCHFKTGQVFWLELDQASIEVLVGLNAWKHPQSTSLFDYRARTSVFSEARKESLVSLIRGRFCTWNGFNQNFYLGDTSKPYNNFESWFVDSLAAWSVNRVA